MRTAAEVMAWTEANGNKHPGDTRTPLGRALWWVAYRQAEEMLGDMTTKDLAEFLLDEHAPISTEEHVQDFINTFFDDPEQPTQEGEDLLLTDLQRFWL